MRERILEGGISASELSSDVWEEITRASLAGIASQTHLHTQILMAVTANEALLGPAVGLTEEAMAAIAQQRASARREAVARAFAERAELVAGVREVRLTAVDSGLVVTVLTEDRDMERDLRLHALFVDLAGELDGEWDLQVRVFSEDCGEDVGLLLP